MRSWGRASVKGIVTLVGRGSRESLLLSPPGEDTRGQPSASQDVGLMDACSARALGVDPQPPEPRDINVLFNPLVCSVFVIAARAKTLVSHFLTIRSI